MREGLLRSFVPQPFSGCCSTKLQEIQTFILWKVHWVRVCIAHKSVPLSGDVSLPAPFPRTCLMVIAMASRGPPAARGLHSRIISRDNSSAKRRCSCQCGHGALGSRDGSHDAVCALVLFVLFADLCFQCQENPTEGLSGEKMAFAWEVGTWGNMVIKD